MYCSICMKFSIKANNLYVTFKFKLYTEHDDYKK